MRRRRRIPYELAGQVAVDDRVLPLARYATEAPCTSNVLVVAEAQAAPMLDWDCPGCVAMLGAVTWTSLRRNPGVAVGRIFWIYASPLDRRGANLMTPEVARSRRFDRRTTPPAVRQLSVTDIAGVVEALTGQRLLPREGAETDYRLM